MQLKRYLLSAVVAAGFATASVGSVAAEWPYTPYQAGFGAAVFPGGGGQAYGYASGGYMSNAYAASGPNYASSGGYTQGRVGYAGSNSTAMWTPYGPMSQGFASTQGPGGVSTVMSYTNPWQGSSVNSFATVPSGFYMPPPPPVYYGGGYGHR